MNTCAVSGLPIHDHFPVLVVPLIQHPHGFDNAMMEERFPAAIRPALPSENWCLRAPPLRATTNAVGGVREIESVSSPVAELWMAGYAHDIAAAAPKTAAIMLELLRGGIAVPRWEGAEREDRPQRLLVRLAMVRADVWLGALALRPVHWVGKVMTPRARAAKIVKALGASPQDAAQILDPMVGSPLGVRGLREHLLMARRDKKATPIEAAQRAEIAGAAAELIHVTHVIHGVSHAWRPLENVGPSWSDWKAITGFQGMISKVARAAAKETPPR